MHHSDAEAQLSLQQQQALQPTKQKSPSKATDWLDAPNHSTGDILSQKDANCQTGPKNSESFAKKTDLK